MNIIILKTMFNLIISIFLIIKLEFEDIHIFLLVMKMYYWKNILHTRLIVFKSFFKIKL